MTFEEIMTKLEELGTEQTKTTFIRHGAKEPLFGVKIGYLKKLVKFVKKDHKLALALYDSGISDAMYLAGLSINPQLTTKEILQQWVKKANWSLLAEYTVAGVAAESDYGLELAREWMNSEDEMIACCRLEYILPIILQSPQMKSLIYKKSKRFLIEWKPRSILKKPRPIQHEYFGYLCRSLCCPAT